jgi:hypothetical protein
MPLLTTFSRLILGFRTKQTNNALAVLSTDSVAIFALSPLARVLAGLHVDRWLAREYGFVVADPGSQGS